MKIIRKKWHRMSKTPVYQSWRMMKDRCLRENCPDYKYYGGRGITICDRWLTFENFLADMGQRPPGSSIDRIDNSGNYEPGNCRWASQKIQNKNRRTSRRYRFLLRMREMKEISEITGVRIAALHSAFYSGKLELVPVIGSTGLRPVGFFGDATHLDQRRGGSRHCQDGKRKTNGLRIVGMNCAYCDEHVGPSESSNEIPPMIIIAL